MIKAKNALNRKIASNPLPFMYRKFINHNTAGIRNFNPPKKKHNR